MEVRANLGRYPKKGERTIKIKIDPWDTWGMDHTLSLLIVPMLKQLKKMKHGYPYTDPTDAPSIGEGTRENDYEFDDKAKERWDWIMDEMIWAHEQIIDEDADMQFHHGEIDFQSKEVVIDGQTYYEMVKGPNDTHTFDKEGWEKWNERKRNGFRLFGKYYENLWD
jgi:hypothetical protein